MTYRTMMVVLENSTVAVVEVSDANKYDLVAEHCATRYDG